jgi:hypothetical protein
MLIAARTSYRAEMRQFLKKKYREIGKKLKERKREERVKHEENKE